MSSLWVACQSTVFRLWLRGASSSKGVYSGLWFHERLWFILSWGWQIRFAFQEWASDQLLSQCSYWDGIIQFYSILQSHKTLCWPKKVWLKDRKSCFGFHRWPFVSSLGFILYSCHLNLVTNETTHYEMTSFAQFCSNCEIWFSWFFRAVLLFWTNVMSSFTLTSWLV